MGFHLLFQEIFLTQGSNLCLLHWKVGSLPLSYQGSPPHIYYPKINWYSRSFVNLLSSVQLLSHVWLWDPMDCGIPGFLVHHQLPELPQTCVHQVMTSNHLILCCPLLLLSSVFPSIRVFFNSWHHEAKVLEFQLQLQSLWCFNGSTKPEFSQQNLKRKNLQVIF